VYWEDNFGLINDPVFNSCALSLKHKQSWQITEYSEQAKGLGSVPAAANILSAPKLRASLPFKRAQWTYSQVVNRLKREGNNWLPTSAKVKNEWSFTSNLPHAYILQNKLKVAIVMFWNAVTHVSVCLKHAAMWQASAGQNLLVMGYCKLSISELQSWLLTSRAWKSRIFFFGRLAKMR
jgi:hypothetical protein